MCLARWPSLFALAVGCWFGAAASAGVDVWTPISPEGGWLGSVVTDPSTSTRLYATTGNGDLFRSSDSGATWTRITPLVPSDCGFFLAVVQSDGAAYVVNCDGVYKSVDAGISWVRQDLRDVGPFAGDPTNPLVLYAIAWDGVRLRIYKTTDGGTSWLPIGGDLPGNPLTALVQLVVDPTLPSRLYLLNTDGVYRSLDSGVTWNPANTGLPSAAFSSLALSSSALFVAAGSYGIYKTADGGTSWTPANNGISIPITTLHSGVGQTLYAAGDIFDETWFFRSTDAGATWLKTGALSVPASFPAGDFAVSRQSDSQLYAASLHGLATSGDGGASWTFHANNGLLDEWVQGLYLDAVDPSLLYAGLQDNLGYKSLDRGAHWSPLTDRDGSPKQPIGISPSQGGRVYGEDLLSTTSSEGGVITTVLSSEVYRSTNYGVDWTLLLSVPGGVVDSLLEAPDVPGRLFAVGNQFDLAGSAAPLVLRSDDDGAHWGAAVSGLPADRIGAIAMESDNSNILYAGVGNRVYKTTNGGGVWVDSSSGLPESRVNALAINPANPNTVFAGLGDFDSAPTVAGLYRSNDGGATWGPRNPAFVNLWISAIAFDRGNLSNVYAGTASGGLYRSTDGGGIFRPINNGLPFVNQLYVNTIAVDPSDGRNLYIGTNAGAFVLTLEQYDSFVSVIEFYNYILDHYFNASELLAEVRALDSGAFAGWISTGQTFRGYPQATGAAQPVCRFYIPPQHGDSHFYSASVSECAAVLDASTNPANPAYPNYSGYVYETPRSFFIDIPANGLCPPGELPVFRLWNRRFDSNHRYTTDQAIRDAMVAKGYVLEGAVMCALQ